MKATAIYMSSKSKYAPFWRGWRERGIPIISTWIDLDEAGAIRDWGEFWEICIMEAQNAEVTILFWELNDSPLKGAFVEVGAALGAGRRVIVVRDPEVDVSLLGSFHHHPNVMVMDSIAEAFAAVGWPT